MLTHMRRDGVRAQRRELLEGVEQLDAAVATQDAVALASLFATDAVVHQGASAVRDLSLLVPRAPPGCVRGQVCHGVKAAWATCELRLFRQPDSCAACCNRSDTFDSLSFSLDSRAAPRLFRTGWHCYDVRLQTACTWTKTCGARSRSWTGSGRSGTATSAATSRCWWPAATTSPPTSAAAPSASGRTRRAARRVAFVVAFSTYATVRLPGIVHICGHITSECVGAPDAAWA